MSKSNNSTTPLQQAIDDLLRPYTRPHDPGAAEAMAYAIGTTGQPVEYTRLSIPAGVGTVDGACDGQGYNLHTKGK